MTSVIRLWFEQIILKKLAVCSKKSYFTYIFDSFSLFYLLLCLRAYGSHSSSLHHSFIKSIVSKSLLSLFKKKFLSDSLVIFVFCFLYVLTDFPLFMPKSESLTILFRVFALF